MFYWIPCFVQGYRFEGAFYPSVGKLLNHYQSNKIPVTNRSQAVLIKPINKIVMATDEYTMKHNDIMLDSKPLGKGRFGHIYSGTIRDSHQRVAVKTCYSKRIAAAQQFLAEAEVMKKYDHPNIIRLLGVCTDKEPVYIVMELMLGGNFLHFLCNHGANQTIYQLTKYALDAALGMEYLASKNCIHRDLAARNCLIGENNEILKITDFGMSTEADDDYIYSWSSDCEPLPVKWTAPEVTTMLYHNNHNYIPFVHETVSQTGHQKCFVFLFSCNHHDCFKKFLHIENVSNSQLYFHWCPIFVNCVLKKRV